MNLFVIGNGFDRAHGLATSYVDFRNYLEQEDWQFLNELERLYGFSPESDRRTVEKYLWQQFEKELSSVDDTEIIDFGLNIDLDLESGDIGIEDTLDAYWEDQYGFIERLNDFLKSWIDDIDINVSKKTNMIKANRNDLFLSFNYTLVLEEVYGMDKHNIDHIHGSIDENDIDPVIGHGESHLINESRAFAYEAGEVLDEKKSSIYNALANYYKTTCKDVKYYLSLNDYFFNKLDKILEIFIVGHSLGDVDMPYFEKIKERSKEGTIWNIYYREASDESIFRDKIISIGVKEENIEMHKSDEFFI